MRSVSAWSTHCSSRALWGQRPSISYPTCLTPTCVRWGYATIPPRGHAILGHAPPVSVVDGGQEKGGIVTLPRWTAPVLVLLGLPVGLLLFFVLWAGLNWSWTQLFDAVVVPGVMEPPCQRLAQTADRLTGYAKRATGRRGQLLQRARCQFGVRQVMVDEATWDKEFHTPELGLFLLDGGLLCVCLVGAILGTVQLGILAIRGWTFLTTSPASPPPPAPPRPRRRRPRR